MKILLKRIVFLGICVMCFSAVGFAETRYVTDLLKLPLRTGPSTEYKILDLVKSGQQLEVVEPGKDWSQVRLPNGKEGYVLNRYLVGQPTSAVQLAKLQSQYTSLRQQATALIEENNRFKEENKKFKSSLNTNETALNKLETDYKELKAGAAEFLSLKKKYREVSTQLAEQTERANTLDKELSGLEMNQYIKWFLAGSGVLLVGFIIGFSAKRGRRRPSLM
ncbi:MAG: TIGR04211 family SH3 domain-containing protein [Desulfobacterales bacterium]|jgi:SH3 domain protein